MMSQKKFVLRSILLSGFFLFVHFCPVALADQFSYPDFIDSTGLNFTGSADVLGAKVRLTKDNDDIGAMWHMSKQSVGDGFETTFEFQIGAGLDDWWSHHTCCGIAFVIQDEGITALGDDEGDLPCGIPGYADIRKSIAISFNTQTLKGDQSIAVHSCGTEPNSSDCKLDSVNLDVDDWVGDTQPHIAKIKYSDNTLSVYLDNLSTPKLELRLNLSRDLSLNNGLAWVGFTSASQDVIYLAPAHDILSWSFKSNGEGSCGSLSTDFSQMHIPCIEFGTSRFDVYLQNKSVLDYRVTDYSVVEDDEMECGYLSQSFQFMSTPCIEFGGGQFWVELQNIGGLDFRVTGYGAKR